ncbi:iron donor protein CyaY [Agaribacter marinus]|uniref:Iron-sulfur cluster assembly protein CyaY n=1 Tax=Agaribacter marinus TaxID=1431249 RepID=A0AA37SV59_9ALTE|nr:iron donor protein CyaY [Agaribacter marinus]GLR69314.1 protein CyaY [Agaribacter marinus]
MKDAQYDQLIDDIFIALEDALDAQEQAFDYDSNGDIFTIIMPDNSKIVLNKQPPLQQLWMATKFNGHHFNYEDDGRWIDERTGVEFFSFLDEAVSKQAGFDVVLALQS